MLWEALLIEHEYKEHHMTANPYYTTSLNSGSAIINWQLVPQTKSGFYYPFVVGPVIQGVPASPPQSPPGYSSSSSPQHDNASMAAANPWHYKYSPLPWLIGMFLVGYILIRWVHWGYDLGERKVIEKAPVEAKK